MLITPEAIARETIDAALSAAGCAVQDAKLTNLFAGRGVALREVSLKAGHGEANYLHIADREACAGHLVLQDPTDGPARTLLARIRAERATAAPVTKRTPRSRGRGGKAAEVHHGFR